MAMQMGKDLAEIIQNDHQETAITRVPRYICLLFFLEPTMKCINPTNVFKIYEILTCFARYKCFHVKKKKKTHVTFVSSQRFSIC